MTQVKVSEGYTLTVTLEDKDGGVTSLNWKISVNVPEIVVPEFIFVPPVEEIVEVFEPNTPILSAKIETLTALGDMNIRFNASM